MGAWAEQLPFAESSDVVGLDRPSEPAGGLDPLPFGHDHDWAWALAARRGPERGICRHARVARICNCNG